MADKYHPEDVEYLQKRLSPPEGVGQKGELNTYPQDDVNYLQQQLGIVPQPAEPSAMGGAGFTQNYEGAWGPAVNFANAMWQGQGTKVRALEAGVGEAGREYMAGVPLNKLGSAFGDAYTQTLSAAEGARANWQKANPLPAVATDIGGSLVTAIPAVAAGGAGLAPLTARVLGPEAAAWMAGRGGAGLVGRLASQGVRGAQEGAAYGALSSGLNEGSVGQQAGYAAAVGAVANPLVGMVAPPLGRYLYAEVRPSVARAVDYLQNAPAGRTSIGVKAPQMMQDKYLREEARALGVTGDEQQLEQITSRVGEAFGLPKGTTSITEADWTKARQNLWNGYADVASRIPSIADHQLNQDLIAIEHDAFTKLNGNADYHTVKSFIDGIRRKVIAGQLDGQGFRDVTRTDNRLYKTLVASKIEDRRQYGHDILDSLRAAVARNAHPADQQELAALNQQYGNLMSFENTVRAAQPSGVIGPSEMASATRSTSHEARSLAQATRLLRDVKASPQGGAAMQGEGNKLTRFLGELVKGGKSGAGGAAAAAIPQLIQGGLPGLTGAGAGLAVGAGLRFARDAYTRKLLNSPYLTERLLAQARGGPIPASPGHLLAAQFVGKVPGAAAAEAANREPSYIYNRGQY